MNWAEQVHRLVARVLGRPEPMAVRVLQAMAAGGTLRSHRYIDGRKEYRLHALSGEAWSVPSPCVAFLEQRGWIQSNQKFPVATYLLTDPGRERAVFEENSTPNAVGARHFHTRRRRGRCVSKSRSRASS